MSENSTLPLLTVQSQGSYEKERYKNKNGILYGTIILTKGILGAGFFLNQYYFVKLGWQFASLFVITIAFFLNYCLSTTAQLANRIEIKERIKIETLNELTMQVLGRKYSVFVKLVIIVLNQIIILTSALLISGFITKRVSILFSVGLLQEAWLHKAVFITVLILLTWIIKEPEKIRFTSMISATMLASVILCLYSLIFREVSKNGFRGNIYESDFEYFNRFSSQMLFSIEAVPSYFSIRATLRYPKDIVKVGFFATFLIIMIYVMNGSLYLFVS